jgi:hypothetical protein
MKGISSNYDNLQTFTPSSMSDLLFGRLSEIESKPFTQLIRERGVGVVARAMVKHMSMDWDGKRLALPPRDPFEINTLPRGHEMLERLYGPMESHGVAKEGAKRVKQLKKSMVPRYYFVIMEVCLDHMDTIDSAETRARVLLALLECGVPDQYVSMLETYFLLGRV